MQDLLQQLDELKTELDSHRPISEERMHRIMQKLRLEWNFNSNSMEGNTLTMTETRKLLYYGITAKGKPLKDHLEMEGHDKALKKLEGLIHKDFKITETLIKDFHKLILANSTSLTEKDVEINPGEWKKNWNFLNSPTGEKIEFADPLDVPDLMSELVNWTNNHLYQDDLNRFKKRKYDLHPLLVACIFHKRFIAIHPFGDGNGRMARLLSNLILMQAGFMPAIVPLQSKDDYYHALNDSTLEDVEPLAKYIGLNLIKSMQLAIEGAKGNPVEEPEDWEKKVELMARKGEGTETYKKIHHWSPENQLKIINEVYVPFLKIIDEKLVKLKSKLFEHGTWNTYLDLFQKEGKVFRSVDKLIEHIHDVNVSNEYPTKSFYYYRLSKPKYEEYKEPVLLLAFSFNEESYEFTVRSGEITLGSELTKVFQDTFDLMNTQKDFKKYKRTFIRWSGYNFIPELEIIEAWCNETMSILVDYLNE